MSDQHHSAFKALIEEAKKGYLTHEDLFNLLPQNYIEPEQIEMVIAGLRRVGIRVYENPPENTEFLETTGSESGDDAETTIEVLTTETRTTDPVRMYMREMGSVQLLTREGEIKIAQRIEEGIQQVLVGVSQYPRMIDSILDTYKQIKEDEERRLTEIIIGFYNEEPTNPQQANVAEEKLSQEIEAMDPPADKKIKPAEMENSDTANSDTANSDTTNNDTNNEKTDGNENKDADNTTTEDSDDTIVDTGPDPIIVDDNMKQLAKLQKSFCNALKKYGRKHATTIKKQKALAEHFSQF